MNKFKIVFIYKDKSTEVMVGIGKPVVKEGFIMFTDPEGMEVIRSKESIQGFNIKKFEG